MGIEFNNQQVYVLYDMKKWYKNGDDQVYNLSGAAGTGKAQPLDTLIPTPKGYRRLGELQIGDYVFNRYKEPTKILGIYEQGELMSYTVHFESGLSTECSINHLWAYATSKTQIEYQVGELSTLYKLHDMKTDIYIPMASNNKNEVIKYDKIISINCTNHYKPMRCIYVEDKEHLYLTNDNIVTHNTTLVRYLIEQLGLELSDVAFTAFMGKAAMQLSRNGLPAQTIHSLIYRCEKVCEYDEDGHIVLNDKGKPKQVFKFVLRDKLQTKPKLIIVDEASMVNKEMGEDLLSFGIPIIALGDLNQLPPVFGNPFFLKTPNYNLTQVMRQEEGDPIVYLAHKVLNDEKLKPGVYGRSCILKREDMDLFNLDKSDIVLTCTNRLRYEVNDFFRTEIKKFPRTDFPYVGEKVICRKNNWSRSLDDITYLTNGTTGTIEYIDKESFNGKELKIDFKPDYTQKSFKNLKIDFRQLFSNGDNDANTFGVGRDKFEFAYAITVHLSQGSQYPKVVFMREDNMARNKEYWKKLQYTAITRAIKELTILI